MRAPSGHSAGVLTLSANGSTAGSGIIWSSMPAAEDGDHGIHAGILRAFNADDLSKELWNCSLNLSRDDSGYWPKFSPPTVVNGRVYLASFPPDGVSNGYINVYGLLSTAQDFAVSASPSSQNISSGGSATYAVSTTAVGAFSGPVTLSVSGLPSGATASFSSNNFATPGSSTLTVKTSSSTPAGSSTLTITGVSGSLTHSVTVSLVLTTGTIGTGVISVDFVGGSTAMAASEVAGLVARSNWNSATASSGSALSLRDESGNSTGATVSWSSSSVWSLPIANTAGNFHMMYGYLDSVGQNTTVTVSGLPANAPGYDVYVYADGDNSSGTRNGTYQLSGPGITTTSISLSDAAGANFRGNFSQANNSTGNFVKFSISATAFTLTAIPGTATDGIQRAPVNGIQIVPHAPSQDFTITGFPSSQTVSAGNSTSYTVTTSALNGFNSGITFAASGLPSGASASFSPSTLSGSGTSALTIATASGTASGTATLTISGTSGSLVHSATTTLIVNTATAAATPTFSPAAGS